jgi:type IV secretory pathway VirB3-like protein
MLSAYLSNFLFVGVTPPEILFSHVVTQFVVMTIQTIMVLVFSFSVFNILCVGSLLWVIILTMLNGLCGMCFGKFPSHMK